MSTTAYFDDIYSHIIQALHNATQSLKICVAWINADRLIPTITQLNRRGVQVEIIYDDNNRNNFLQWIGIAHLYPVNTRHPSAFMHNKFCIIDDETLITGSFNWTLNAGNSFENIVIIKRDYNLIKSFLHEFEDLKNFSNYENSKVVKQVCRYSSFGTNACRSEVYNIGIFSYVNEYSLTSKISIYKVCRAHQHAQIINTIAMEDDDSDVLEEIENDTFYNNREEMLYDFGLERGALQLTPNFLRKNLGCQVHAYGHIVIENEGQWLKYSVAPEYVVKVLWRDMYWRKIIPSVLRDESGISNIIDQHRPGSI